MAIALSLISLILAAPIYWAVLKPYDYLYESPNVFIPLSLVPLFFGIISSLFVYIWTIKDIKKNRNVQKGDVISMIFAMPSVVAVCFLIIIVLIKL